MNYKMKTTYNYATHKNEMWYSEEAYEALRQENQEAKEIIAELEYKCKKLEKEILNERIST